MATKGDGRRGCSTALAWGGVGVPRPRLRGGVRADRGLPGQFWASFGAAENTRNTAEEFDHAAAKLYLEADDPRPTADQQERVRRILYRHRQMICTPLVTSYEELDPYFGRWCLSVLLYGFEYAAHKITNRECLFLNNPPVTLPPREIKIHLCWGAGYANLGENSVLQGVSALLLDDWREALAPLPIRFFAQRLAPLSTGTYLGRCGLRWRDTKTGRIPPRVAIGALFRRANYADAAADGDWRVDETARRNGDWWMACLLEPDLEGLGFTRSVRALNGEPVWSAADPKLPERIEHIILVPPRGGGGVFLRVVRESGRSVLEPLRVARQEWVDHNYFRLRVRALDLALEALWEKTR